TIVILTHSVFSIVWGMLISAVLEVILSMVFIKPRPKFAIEKNYFKEIFHRGIWVTGYTVFNYFSENLDNVVVGRFLGATDLGLYQMAYKIAILPLTEVSDVVSSVVFPIFTKITNDTTRLKKAFYKSVALVFFGSAFLGLIVFFFPEVIITILLGKQWLTIVPVLKILIIYGVLRTLSGPTSAIFLSLSKQKYVSSMIFFRFITLAIFIYPLVIFFGLVGAGYAQLLSVFIELPVMVYIFISIFKNISSPVPKK
ncbi:MAG TPA: oligosaccharide flippase family protein, partial [Verrucomicrobiae bacterium]|nr:oligosaccharide flippase family protein [Verrucomicrobiae bacterium]